MAGAPPRALVVLCVRGWMLGCVPARSWRLLGGAWALAMLGDGVPLGLRPSARSALVYPAARRLVAAPHWDFCTVTAA